MGHTYFYRGVRECFTCRGVAHEPPPGVTEEQLEEWRYKMDPPWGYDTADGSTRVEPNPDDVAAAARMLNEAFERLRDAPPRPWRMDVHESYLPTVTSFFDRDI